VVQFLHLLLVSFVPLFTAYALIFVSVDEANYAFQHEVFQADAAIVALPVKRSAELRPLSLSLSCDRCSCCT
jgi:hypothetical protein